MAAMNEGAHHDRHRIHPLPDRSFQRDAFEEYARRWLTIIRKCGGNVVGF